MSRRTRTMVMTCVTFVLAAALCVLPGSAFTRPDSVPAGASEAPAAAGAASQAALPQVEKGVAATAGPPKAGASRPRAATEAAAEAVGSEAAAPRETPAVGEAEGAVEDSFYTAALTSPAPDNFTVTYTTVKPNNTAHCSWNAVNVPTAQRDLANRYCVYRWDQDSYDLVRRCYLRLVDYEPAAGPYFTDLDRRVSIMIDSSGLTVTERQALLDEIEVDVDALNDIMCSSTDNNVAKLLEKLKGAAKATCTNNTSLSVGGHADNTYYWYAVVTRGNRGIDTSPLSHTEAIFATTKSGKPLSQPKDVTAKAFDPGVFVEWSRNTEPNLAGYNVYLVSDTRWTLLNTSGLITTGTEYYYAAGTPGQTFGVRAVNTSDKASSNSETARAVLQPATTYAADDAGWSTTDIWKVENYSQLPPPFTGVANLLVAQGSGATASHAFTGRRVKLYASTYWSCGAAEILIDGQPVQTVNLYKAPVDGDYSPSWGVNVFTVSGLSAGKHTIAIRCLGRGGDQGYNFVNVQYIEAL